MSKDRKRLGGAGEELACRYLERRGYEVLERNFRCRIGEADLIALYGRELCFVEVKTRRSRRYGLPCLAVTAHKQETIRRLAQVYLALHPQLSCLQPRFDVIELLRVDGSWYLRHLPGAF